MGRDKMKSVEEFARELYQVYYGGNPGTNWEDRDSDFIMFWMRLATHVRNLIIDGKIEEYKRIKENKFLVFVIDERIAEFKAEREK